MLPNAIDYVRGTKDTSVPISAEKPLEISNKIYMFDPNRNKALGWTLRNGGKQPTTEHTFGHLEDVPNANWVHYAGATETSQGVTGLALRTGDGARVTLGSRIYFPDTKQIIRLDAVMATDTTGAVTRNFGRGASTSYLKTGDKGLLLTPAFEQGFTTGAGVSNPMEHKTFNTTIVSYPVQTTHTETAEKSRGGNPFQRSLKKAIKQSKDQMEAELLYGASYSDSSSYAHPLTTAQGLDSFITTNVYSASTISRMDLWDILMEWKMTNKAGGAIWCSTMFQAMVTQWALGMTYYEQDTKKDGMKIDVIKTPVGEFELIPIDLLDQEPNLAGDVFFIPKGMIDYRPLIHSKNLDVRYNPISRDEVHSDEGEVYGEYGWHYYEEEQFMHLSGLQLAS